MKLKVSPKIVIFIATFFTSMVGIIIRFLKSPAMTIVFYRSLFTLIMTFIMFLFSNRIDEIKKLTTRQIKYIIVAGLSFSVIILTNIFAIRYTTIACALVISDIHPIFVVVIMILFFKERFHKLSIIGIIIALLGLVIIFGTDLLSKTGNIVGDIFALINAVCMAVFLTIGGMLRKEVPTILYMLLYNISCFIIIGIVSIVVNTPLLGLNTKEYALIFLLTFFGAIIGFGLTNWAMKYLKSSFISTAYLVEPFYASIMALILFKEILSLQQLIGFLIVFSGILIYNIYENKLKEDIGTVKKASQ